MIFEKKNLTPGFRFSLFEKSENQLFFFNYFLIQSYIFFKDASGSIPVASRKAIFGFEICLETQGWVLVGQIDSWKAEDGWFAIFFIREKRKPAVVLRSTVF